MIIRRPESAMHGYQHELKTFFRDIPFSIGLVDMGLGKTVCSLSLIADLIMEGYDGKILIVGPLKVVTDVWPTEFQEWDHLWWMKYTLIRVPDDHPRLIAAHKKAYAEIRELSGGPKDAAAYAQKAVTKERQRIMAELAHSPQQIHIINREMFEWLATLHGRNWPYRVLFLDESASFKDNNTKRFEALRNIRCTDGLIERIHMLTATPCTETYMHLFTQIFLLDKGARLGRFITHFRNDYFDHNKYSQTYKLKPGADERILAKIHDLCIVMKREDYLPRDQPTIIRRKVKLQSAHMALMKDLERTCVLKLPDGKTKIPAKSAAMVSSMVLQMASGNVYETYEIEDYETGDLKKVKRVHHIHDEKIEALREIVEAAKEENRPLIVAYHFKASLARLQKAFPKAVVMDDDGKCIKKWNAGKIEILLIHYQSAGHGLNLQYGGSTMVMYDLHWSLEVNLQIIGRIDRQGQTKPVVVEMLIAEGTKDEDVAAALLAKEDAHEKLFKILKRLIREARKLQAEHEPEIELAYDL